MWMKKQTNQDEKQANLSEKQANQDEKQANLSESVLYIVYLLIVVGTVTNRHQPYLTSHQTFSLKVQPIKRK